MKKSFGVWIIVILAIISYYSYSYSEEVPKVTNVKVSVVKSKPKLIKEKPKRECINGLLYYIKKDGTLIRIEDENGYPIECNK